MTLIKPLITTTLLMGSIVSFFSHVNSPVVTNEAITKKTANEIKVAPFFIANNGQIDDDVHFYVKGSQHSFFLKESGEAVTRSIYKEDKKENSDSVLPGVETANAQTVREVGFTQTFIGANRGVLPKAGERAIPILNFFTGNKKTTEVPTYNDFTYKNLYDGIDLTYRVSKENKVKYDLIVGAGVDPRNIVMQFAGVQDLFVDFEGNLQMKTPAQTFTQHKPYVYQLVNGVEQAVAGSYKVNISNNTVSFALGNYNLGLPLIIDPVLDQLGASTLYGGSGADSINSLVRNSSDQIYVTGSTDDSTTDLPVISGGYDISHNGGNDAFVARFDNNLEDLTYATYIGGSSSEYGEDIALDTNGKVVMVGHTNSGASYPTTAGSYSSSSAGGFNILVSRFSANLADLEASSRFGGSETDTAYGLYINSSNIIYILGSTGSSNFPEVNGNYQSSYGGGEGDVFVAKLPSDLTSLESTYLGGAAGDYIYSGNAPLVADSSGNIYVGGYTFSSDFPTTGSAYDTTFSGSNYEAFISKFSSDLTSLSASTYFGSTGVSRVVDLIFDSNGALYASIVVVGTVSTTPDVLQTDASKGYIGKFTSNLQTLSVGTYFGGAGVNVYPRTMTLDSSDNVYIAGIVSSTIFATTSGAYDTSYNGGAYDGFVSKITANLQTLSESTYIGGSGEDYILAIALNVDQDNVFVAGYSDDSTTDYPTTGDAYDTTHNGLADGFITIFGAIGGIQGGGGGSSVPEFSTYIYLITLFWCGYLLFKKFNPQFV